MSRITVEWDNETRTIIKYVYQQGWDWQDYQTAIESAARMIGEENHPVNVIMDFRSASMLPAGAITHVQKALSYPRHPLVRLTAIVGANAFIRRIADIGQKLSRKQSWDLSFVTTPEEAYKRFEQSEQSAVRGNNE
jgi:hypothetical protein